MLKRIFLVAICGAAMPAFAQEVNYFTAEQQANIVCASESISGAQVWVNSKMGLAGVNRLDQGSVTSSITARALSQSVYKNAAAAYKASNASTGIYLIGSAESASSENYVLVVERMNDAAKKNELVMKAKLIISPTSTLKADYKLNCTKAEL